MAGNNHFVPTHCAGGVCNWINASDDILLPTGAWLRCNKIRERERSARINAFGWFDIADGGGRSLRQASDNRHAGWQKARVIATARIGRADDKIAAVGNAECMIAGGNRSGVDIALWIANGLAGVAEAGVDKQHQAAAGAVGGSECVVAFIGVDAGCVGAGNGGGEHHARCAGNYE